jgi:hypothetical protein
MDIPEDRFNVREIEKFYRKLLDSLNKGQYQFMYSKFSRAQQAHIHIFRLVKNHRVFPVSFRLSASDSFNSGY